MSHENTPHACFKAPSPGSGAASDLLQLIEQHLRDQFDSVRVRKAPGLTSWLVVLNSGTQTVAAVIGPSKYDPGEWILIVGPGERLGLLDRLLRTNLSVPTPELKHACSRIDRALAAIPGLSAVRWYFEGTQTQSAAVTTPDELLWGRE